MTLPAHPLTNFEIQEYYQNELRFNGVFSRDNLPNIIKNGAYVVNLDEYHDTGTHWIALYVNNKIVTYFDSFGVENIPKEIMKFFDRKKIITTIYRIQAYDSIMCGYFCIGFINFMFNGKSLTDYTNLFSPNDFHKNDYIILNYFGYRPKKMRCKMSNSNLEVNAMNRVNAMSELNDLTKYRLDENNKIKDYLNSEIKERKYIIKKIKKYIVAFDYADKVFITLSASFGTLSIASYSTIVGIPAGIAGASLTLIFTVTTGVVKTFLNITRKKKKKHNKIIALARNKLNVIENLISQALIDSEITHEEFSKIIYEKNNYEQIIDNIRNAKNADDLNKENN